MAPGNFILSPNALETQRKRGLIAAVIGFALLLLAIVVPSGAGVAPLTQFFHSYLLGFMVFFGLCVGSLGLLLLQYLTGGAWGIMGRRIFEAGSRIMPIAAILFIPVIIGMYLNHIFEWTIPEVVKASPVLTDKAGYLNSTFWTIRAIVYFAYLIIIGVVLNKYAQNLDREPGHRWSRKLENFSGGALLFFFFAVSFAAIDWIMSLAPEWYSTIYGFIIIVGEGILALTFAIMVLVTLSKEEPMSGALIPGHLHDLGKLLFAFNFLWGYFCFSQLIIIYAGNLPEEIVWYHHRIRGGWQVVAYIVIFVHFIVPFAILLSRDLKRNGRRLMMMAAWLFIMRIVDLYWLIEPNWHREQFFFSWADVAAPVGFVGLYVYLFVGQYKKKAALPTGEPELGLALHPRGAHG
ncbi:MAG: hypothetical protein Q8922_13730 [Bacteroidota bacterium]|nr:hypothetical protein [Bacteroidota bacterium]MDP4234621.1 hypothetical protein [Bacteroidota bacterium]MDP4243780.1 hypothetical protein [Bacteroidota bacterium]MDP4288982.1 hypothetical protein [Bacteroidota bacterium]